MMLSLPEDWNYTTRGLAAICKRAWTLCGVRCGSWKLPGTLSAISCETGRVGSAIPSMLSTSNHSRRTRIRPSRIRLHQIRKPGYGKTGYGKARRIKYREIKYRKTITYGSSTDSIPFREQRRKDRRNGKEGDAMSVTRDRKLSGVDFGEYRV